MMVEQGRIVGWNQPEEWTVGRLFRASVGRALCQTIVPELHREARGHGLQHVLEMG